MAFDVNMFMDIFDTTVDAFGNVVEIVVSENDRAAAEEAAKAEAKARAEAAARAEAKARAEAAALAGGGYAVPGNGSTSGSKLSKLTTPVVLGGAALIGLALWSRK